MTVLDTTGEEQGADCLIELSADERLAVRELAACVGSGDFNTALRTLTRGWIRKLERSAREREDFFQFVRQEMREDPEFAH